jgi:hypothetical protein
MASKKYPLRRKSFAAYRFQLHGSFMLAVDIWYRPYKTGENVAKPAAFRDARVPRAFYCAAAAGASAPKAVLSMADNNVCPT